MEPKFQNSFIPKNVSAPPSAPSESKAYTVNIFSIIATVLFVGALLASGGAFIYKNIMINGISQANKDLDAARKAFEPEKITQLIEASANIRAATELLTKHVVVSKLLVLLQQLTVTRLRFNSLTYTNREGNPTIDADVEAQSYNALAQQINILTANDSIRNPSFSGLGLGTNGVIKLKFSTNLVPTFVSYKDFIETRSIGVISLSSTELATTTNQ